MCRDNIDNKQHVAQQVTGMYGQGGAGVIECYECHD